VIDKIYLHLIYHLDRQYKHLKSNHPSHRHWHRLHRCHC
jgi:hypothetical protein